MWTDLWLPGSTDGTEQRWRRIDIWQEFLQDLRFLIQFSLWIIMMTLPLSSCKLKWQCHHNFVKQKQPSKEEFWLSGRTVLNCWNKYSLLIFYFHRFQTVPEETLGQFWRLPRGCFARIYFAEYKFIFFSQNLRRLHVKFCFWMTSICQFYLFIQWWKIQ